ncbi:hypothetical protein F5Y18DRAFT_420279 [Xylariaceae sp. FL1019]|nr:hypothetical protein F5Y18DRAFT_420279 [Xylariaceae sp. FL1019]
MADTLSQATPTPKKLFKPSSKTKTPTPVRRFTPSTSSSATTAQPSQLRWPTSRTTTRTPSSARSTVSQSTESLRGASPLDDVFQSTNLAPLRYSTAAASGKLAPSIASDISDFRSGPIDSDTLSLSDTLSHTTDDRSPSVRRTTGNFKGFSPSFKEKVSRARALSKTKRPTEGARGRLADTPDHILQKSTSNLSEASSSATDKPEPIIDLAKYFHDRGNPEMSHFVSALLGGAPARPSEIKRKVAEATQPDAARAAQSEPSDKLSDSANKTMDQKDIMQQSGDVSKKAEGAAPEAEGNLSGAVPTNKVGEPDAASISRAAQPAIPSLSAPRSAKSPPTSADGTQEFDNMGRPARIDRRIEIPLQRPKKVAESHPEGHARGGLGDVNDLPNTDNLRSTDELRSTDDLPEIPDDESQDPPEEILDPSVHSSSTSITPIPKIPKIAPIDSAPPVNLERLAKGLAGHVVDDVGNVVDESGEVLGHATGDLPSMVGKKVSNNGEIYGEDGEVIGYVSDNFVNPPEPTEIPSEVLGGLKVDHQGNILDSNGNVIGKFNQKPGQTASNAKADGKPKEEQKPKVNAHTGGSPSDIFLDVKSTNDGIQLTIRIPTTFKRSPQEAPQEAPQEEA